MKLRIERMHARMLAEEFPELATLVEQLRFGATREVFLRCAMFRGLDPALAA